MIALTRLAPFVRPLILTGAACALLAAWTVYQRHDAVSDYRAAQALEIEQQRALDRATAQETRRNVENLDDRSLRDSFPIRVPASP